MRKQPIRDKKEDSTGISITPKVSLLPSDYADVTSALIQYGSTLARKDFDKGLLLSDGKSTDTFSDTITEQQATYLNMRGAGLTPNECCQLLGINRATPMLWEETENKAGTFNQCVQIIRAIEADDLEATVWKSAKEGKSDILKMFALKSRKNEYKDNAAPVTTNNMMLRITIDGDNFDTSASFKNVGDVISE